MAYSDERILRQQIAESFRHASEQMDLTVALALTNEGQFEHRFGSEELSIVFSNIFYTLIEIQNFAGLKVPLTYNIPNMEVELDFPRVRVNSLLHIHSPIRAFIQINYALVNHATKPGSLTLARRSVRVVEKTSRLDVVARAALLAINIEGLVQRELQDPGEVIRQTLPIRLKEYGFDGGIGDVMLAVTPDNHLHAILRDRVSTNLP